MLIGTFTSIGTCISIGTSTGPLFTIGRPPIAPVTTGPDMAPTGQAAPAIAPAAAPIGVAEGTGRAAAAPSLSESEAMAQSGRRP